jgi:hypothetical protein
MDYLDYKYINLLSGRLRNFQKKDNNLYNFSCNLCGDSHKNQRKARAYIFEKKGQLFFYCHNCLVSLTLANFIKHTAPEVFEQYLFEQLKPRKEKPPPTFVSKKLKLLDIGVLRKLKKVSHLPENHPCKKFVNRRKIPTTYHWKLFYCPRYMTWVNENVIVDKFSNTDRDEPRLVIPFFDEDGNVFAFQGRSLNPSSCAKYITISLNTDKHVAFGLDTVDTSKTIYVLEGPIDSMFLSNSVAVAGSYLPAASTLLPKEKLVLIFDNEPRNKQIVTIMKEAIANKYKVVILPATFIWKDINDAIMDGKTIEYIKKVISNHIYDGLQAQLRLSSWQRI